MDTNIELKNGEVSVIAENGTTLIMNVDTLFELIDKLKMRSGECNDTCTTSKDEEERCICKCHKEKECSSEDSSGYIKLLHEILGVKDEGNEDEDAPDAPEDDDDNLNEEDDKDSNQDTDEFSSAIMDLFNEILDIAYGKKSNDKQKDQEDNEEETCVKTTSSNYAKIAAFEYHIPKYFNPDTYDFRKGIGDVIDTWDNPKDAMDEMNESFGMSLTEENITNIADSWESIGNLLHDGVTDTVHTGLSTDIKEYYEYITGNKYPHKYTHLYTVNRETGEAFVFMWVDPKTNRSKFKEEILDMLEPVFEE